MQSKIAQNTSNLKKTNSELGQESLKIFLSKQLMFQQNLTLKIKIQLLDEDLSLSFQ